MKGKVILVILAIACFCQVSPAQSAFSYQGSLKNAGAPANGNHDFEFRLWDAASGGAQVGATVQLNGVAVTNGIFAVTLDFGDQFPGTIRFLEVRVRPTGTGAFTPLTPREVIKAVPYAVTSLNSVKLGGVAANQYVTTTTGGANFIQNTTTQQASSNFNISGFGIANVFRASTQFDIGTSHALSMPGTDNIFAGGGAGQANTTGIGNSFFGRAAGFFNTSGTGNSFFGLGSGQANTTGSLNAFFGTSAGLSNTIGGSNAFFGMNAGRLNSVAGGNAFFGWGSGSSNTAGNVNSFFGRSAGASNTTGGSNSFFGANAGESNTTGFGNTMFGNGANVASGNLSNATAIGASAQVSQSNSLVLGSINGIGGATADTNVGIGTTAPGYKLHVVGENLRVEANTTSIFPRFSLNFTGGVVDGKKWQNYASAGGLNFTALNDAENSENRWLRVNRGVGTVISSVQFENGVVVINNLGAAGAVGLCRNAASEISTCSSSLKYKTNVSQFSAGLAFVNKLKPISYDWKDGGLKDVGFGAEDIAEIDPRFVTYNPKGEVEGVKYDRLSVAFVNAFKEQQAEISGQGSVISGQQRKIDDLNSQIETQKAQIEQHRKELDALKKLVCAQNLTADVCKEEK